LNRQIARRTISFAALLVAIGFGACSSPAPLDEVMIGDVRIDGNVVSWETNRPAMGAVRYGSSSGEYNRVAYPRATLRRDRSVRTDHTVQLLEAARGATVFMQVLNRTEDGRITVGEEVSFTVTTRPPEKPVLRWTMIDVGFGDAHYVVMPNTDVRVLIDGGERRDWPNVDAFLKTREVDRLEVVMGTHIHADHIGGLVGDAFTLEDGVLGAYPVDLFLDSPNKSAGRSAYTELLATLSLRGTPADTVAVGDTDANNPGLDWDPAVTVEVFNSGFGRSIGGGREGDWLNNDSILLRLQFGEFAIMLGGDSEAPVEDKLVRESASRLESNVLKVHHHGLDDTSQPAFLDAVNPRVGKIPITTYESFNGTLPSGAVLNRLRTRMIDIYASDRAEPLGIELTGDRGINVTVVTDGDSYEIQVEASVTDHTPPSKPDLRGLLEECLQ
jgi:beta-lactamase superfamily II metal-dependent hydrolase